IIDTGVDAAHPDLKDRVTMERNFVDAGSAQFNRDRHGTEIAGVIAAVANNREGIVGIAPGASVLALKACWQLKPQADEAQCNSFTLAQALTVAIESSAQVVNLSLGGPADPLLSQLVEYGLQQGIIFVGAVPPDGGMSGFPVGVPGVIAVDVSGRAAGDAQVLHAPGREILTLTPGGHYDFASGSSIAAAHVTGVVALLLAQDAHLNAAAAYALLSRSSTSTADDRRDNVSINACVALTALRLHGSCDQTAAPSATAADASGATALKAEH
ncbi:MAG: S8 family peptidase, partial [Stenotrophobium sp.]